MDLSDESRLKRLRALGRLLDNSIRVPGTDYHFGLDGLIGLVPGIGDAVGALLALYILNEAKKFGVSRATMARMVWNVILDLSAGAVPIVGDVFDFVWKANKKNLQLLDAHLARTGRHHGSSTATTDPRGLLEHQISIER